MENGSKKALRRISGKGLLVLILTSAAGGEDDEGLHVLHHLPNCIARFRVPIIEAGPSVGLLRIF
jgi:hypothetical protein